jgi:uncharacterized protein YlxP (DUF503 family)
MFVGLLVVDCRIGEGHSLKEKRRILQSLFAHLKRDYNVSIAEVEHQDKWQRAKLAISHVNTDGRAAQATLNRVLEVISSDPRLMVMDSETIPLC